MKTQEIKYPLVKLPAEAQISLYLIREELKSRRLFQSLHQVGLDDCWFQPHLDSLILESMGMEEYNDEMFARYDAILEKRSRKIEASNDSVMKQAMKVYGELCSLKAR